LLENFFDHSFIILNPRYTSSFLRENAQQKQRFNNGTPSQLLKTYSTSQLTSENQRSTILDSARMSQMDESLVLGTCYWEDFAQEPV
jgi:hypothetical protein